MSETLRPLRLLLVDDDQVDRLSVKRLLRQAGIVAEVEEHADRAGALAAVCEHAFDCALLDYRLPGTDGLSLLRDLRSSGVGIPVVALTGQGDEEVAVELMKAGAADYLNKNTLTAERLERSLRYALALHRVEEDRRRLLAREQEARLEAQAANHAKDQFLATLSHELRTPLNAILGWAQLLAGGQLDQPTAARAVQIIERNTRLQAQLIDDLLDISRIVSGKVRLDVRSVAMRALVDAAVELALPPASAKRVTIERTFDAVDDPIECDPARMQQIIWNLLNNAIKFTPEGGRVSVTEERRGGAVVLTVADTGVGIEPSFLPHVFDRFRQQDAASTRSHGGLGLGLYIVRHLVELHGGTIQAFSDGKGQGATFVVSVPTTRLARSDDYDDENEGADDDSDTGHLQHRQHRPHRPRRKESELPSLEGIRVLVVDNEADARGLMSAILERCGADVTAVESVADAMREIIGNRPDVLLSDIGMPGEDGYSLIRKVRQLTPSTRLPAAALTAYAAATDRAQALHAGYQAHLPKPIEPAELTALVASLAGRAAQHGHH